MRTRTPTAPPATAGGSVPTAPPATAGGSVYCAAMEDSFPLAYLITFRCHGTWLHGDERGSVDRFHNQYGTPCFPANEARLNQNNHRLNHTPVILNSEQRHGVERGDSRDVRDPQMDSEGCQCKD